MKLVLPDGREYPAKIIGTARNDAMIELQMQTGLRAQQLNERMEISSAFVNSVVHFLSRASAGDKVKWSEVMAMTQPETGRIELEPGDDGYTDPDAPAADEAESDPAADPQLLPAESRTPAGDVNDLPGTDL